MDDEVIFGQIDYIEEQVEFLIELCNSLKAENAEMKSKLESLELELKWAAALITIPASVKRLVIAMGDIEVGKGGRNRTYI